MKRLVLALPLLLGVAACDLVYRPDEPDRRPPSTFQTPLPPPATSSLPPPPEPGPEALVDSIPGKVTVAPGDVLSKIARAHNIPTRAIIDENKLEPPYTLDVGQVLVIPAVRRYTIQPGDTIPIVGHRYNVEPEKIAALNHLQPHDILKVGLPLILPPAMDDKRFAAPGGRPLPPPPTIAATPMSPPTVAATPVPSPLPDRPKAVASAPETAAPAKPVTPPPASEPAEAPSEKTEIIPVPEKPAVLPAPEKQAVIATPEKALPPVVAAAVPAPEAAESADQAEPPLAPAQQTAATAAAVANHRPPVAPLFTWPVRGKVISTFGALPNGAHNDGLNIAAAEGTEVDAADTGVVVYAGNALRGFGNLLLIKHADGWVTAYGHNSELLVKVGDHVRRGQAIAKVGSTGRVSGPQLHFEVRRGTDQGNKAFDPLDHLPASSGD